MRQTIKVLFLYLSFFIAPLTLSANDGLCLFDPYPLGDVLSPGEDHLLPRSMGTASEALLLGLSSTGSDRGDELAYFQYSRGTLVLEPAGVPSEKTLIRLFLDSRGEPLVLSGQNETNGTQLSRPFQGGTLYFNRLKPFEAEWLTNKKNILTLESSPGVFTSHFETGNSVFWLGNGVEYYCYDQEGSVIGYHNLSQISWSGRDYPLRERALFSAMFDEGRLCLVLEGGEILFLGVQKSDTLCEKAFNLTGLFVHFYRAGVEYLENYRKEQLLDFKIWAALTVESLYKKDPLNRELSALYLQLN